MAAEYILKEGNEAVMLCERGIRTYEPSYRFTLDLMAVPVLRELTHLPIVIDPSHAAGKRSLVEPLSLAAAAAGADGIIVEIHPCPRRPSATARRRCTRTSSPPTCASSRRRRSWPASSFRRCEGKRPRRGADRRVDRPGREGARRGRRGGGLRPRPRAAPARAGARRDRPRRGDRSRRPSRELSCASPARPWARSRSWCARRSTPPATTRSSRDVGSTKQDLVEPHARPPLRGRAPDRRRRDGGRGARARRPLPGRRLVPHAARAVRRAPLRAPAPLRGGARRAPRGGRRRDPRPARRRVQPPAARARERARLAGGRAPLRARRGAPPGRPELPRHDARRGREHRASGATSTAPTAPRSSRRSAASARARRGGAAPRAPARSSTGTTARARTGAPCSRRARPRGRCTSFA